MIEILKKLKGFMPASVFVVGVLLFFSLFCAFCSSELPTVRYSAVALDNTHDKLQTNIPEFPYALHNTFRTNPFSALNSARRNFHPVPPAYRTQDLSSLPLAGQIVSPIRHYFYEGERSHFQKYIKYSLPLRAGPHEV